MRIDFVTFTGADDKTNISDLSALGKDYPSMIEWGILLSSKNEKTRRFPSRKWIGEFVEKLDSERISGHLCGKYARDIISGRFTFAEEQANIVEMFDRFQINFHGLEYEIINTPLIEAIGKGRFIFQIDGVNDFRFWEAVELEKDVFPLFDLSHGEGVSPENWQKPYENIFCGYAGGLGPDNLADELKRIEDVVGDETIWIDMETKIRNDQDEFDVKLVGKCMEIAESYF
mgnify:FL=1